MLTGYTGIGMPGNYAIVDKNSNPSQADVYAYSNFFGNLTTPGVGYVILDHLDDAGYTTVLFSNATNVNTPTDVYVYYGWSGSAADAALSIDGTSPTTGQFGYNEFANIEDAIDSVISGGYAGPNSTTLNGVVHVYFGTYTQNLVFTRAKPILRSRAKRNTAPTQTPPTQRP